MRAVARMRGSEVSPHQRLLEALEGEDTGDGVLSSTDFLNAKPHAQHSVTAQQVLAGGRNVFLLCSSKVCIIKHIFLCNSPFCLLTCVPNWLSLSWVTSNNANVQCILLCH